MPASQYSKSFRLDLNAWYEDTRAHLHSEMIQSLIDSFIHSKFGRALISWHEFVYQVSTVSSLSNYLGSRERRPKMGSAWRSSIIEIDNWNIRLKWERRWADRRAHVNARTCQRPCSKHERGLFLFTPDYIGGGNHVLLTRTMFASGSKFVLPWTEI